MRPKVSILLPHFQTPKLTLLCLRLLRLKTRGQDYETIVIDNGSTDGSGEALRRIRWIRMLRREAPAGERPARSHGLALNLGVAHAEAPYVLTMHTDTMVLRPDWLDYLVSTLESHGPNCATVGSWKMESQGKLQRMGKWLEEACRQLRGRFQPQKRYIRSHCALYRKEAVLCRPGMFDPTDSRSAGEELHDAIEQAGLECHFLPPHVLCNYVRHLNHATMALNREFGKTDPYMPRTRARAIRRIEGFFQSIRADEILADHSLDR